MKLNQPNAIESLWLGRINELVDQIARADWNQRSEPAARLAREQLQAVYGSPIPRSIDELDRCRCAAE